MEVKKLMAKRMFLGVSRGKMPANHSASCGSCSRWFSLIRPMFSDSSCGQADKYISRSLITMEDACKPLSELRVLQPLVQVDQAHILQQLLSAGRHTYLMIYHHKWQVLPHDR